MGQMKVNNVIRIPSSLKTNFFNYWLNFLRPFHSLTDREIQVAAAFLKHRYELSKAITDEALLDKIVMNDDTKRSIREECNISSNHFQVKISKLKKAKFIIDNRINPKFIPNVKEDGNFQLLLLFDFNG